MRNLSTCMWLLSLLIWCIFCLLLFGTSAIDCLERLVSKLTYYVSNGTLNPTRALTFVLSIMQSHCTTQTMRVLVKLCKLFFHGLTHCPSVVKMKLLCVYSLQRTIILVSAEILNIDVLLHNYVINDEIIQNT